MTAATEPKGLDGPPRLRRRSGFVAAKAQEEHAAAARGRRLGRALRRAAPAVAAVVLACSALVPRAAAFEMPSAAGLSLHEAPTDDSKRLHVFLGIGAGTDSNYNMAPPGSEEKSSVTETIGGVALLGGNNRKKYELRYEERSATRSGVTGEGDSSARRVVAGVATQSQKVEFGFRTRYAWLSDPAVIEDQKRFLERTELTYVPEVSLSTGRTEVGLSYRGRSLSYDESTTRLDHSDDLLGTEFRWWRSEITQFFVRRDAGSVDYDESISPDFDYTRIYGGLRMEVPSRMGLELAVGTQTVDNFADAPSRSESDFYATARMSFSPAAGTSRLEFACAVVDEASTQSSYKHVAAFEVRYLRRVNRRLTWSARLRSESVGLEYPFGGSIPGSVSATAASASASLDVGSLRKAHGRLFATVAYQTRSADHTDDSYDFDRLVATGGLALVY